ncbi:MAG: TonB-dependent receptor [Novosphingobium sp.]|nr:TonB-dependent receptor [Novosphingobium sp.]
MTKTKTHFALRKAFLLAASGMMLPLGGTAFAQDSGTAVEEGAYGDIIVTAQRRAELSRDVPISLTTISSDDLTKANITDTTGLEQLTPSLKLDRQGNFTAPALRGISGTVTGPAMDNNVAIYVDGVYMPSTTAGTFDLPDIERVEVLKGPQGTLFGRNATGGAIQVITKKPQYTAEGLFSASYGRFDDVFVKGYVSAPVVDDKAAISLSAYYHRSDSYYKNLRPDSSLDGEESWQIRGKLRWNPAPNLEMLFSAAYGERSETFAIYGTPVNGNTLTRLLDPNAIIPSKPYEAALNDEVAPQKNKSLDISGRIELTLDAGTLTSTTAYLTRDMSNGLDSDMSYSPLGLSVVYFPHTFDQSFSEELTFASDLDGPLNFTLGASYVDGKGGWNPLSVDSPGVANDVTIWSTQKIKAFAAYGEAYFDLTDRLTLIGGLRYSWEKRSLEGNGVFGEIFAPDPGQLHVATKSWDSITPRASIKYEVTPTSNVYFTYSQGFKSGVFNSNNPFTVLFGLEPDVVNPEKIKSYELGFKGRMNSVLSLEMAGFYYDYTNLQTTIITIVGGAPLSVLRNAKAARVYGLEADASLRFSDMFDMRFAGAWVDAKYKNFQDTAINVPCTDYNVPCGTDGPVPTLGGNGTVPFDASGQRMIRAPKFTGTVTANGHVPVGGGKLDLTASVYYSTSVSYTLDQRIKQPSFAKVDARAAWSPDDSGLTFSVYGKNLTNKAVYAGAFITPVADAVHWAAPRTYGVQVDYRF